MSLSRTVVCLKWGDMYGPEYVNRLFAMVRRNVEVPVRFVCFTDDPTGLGEGIEIKPLPDFPEPAYKYARYCSAWRKLALFDSAKTGLEGRVLFLDLDIVILRSLEPLLQGDAPFMMLENWYQPGKGQASVMRFDGDVMQPVLARYLVDPIAVLEEYVTEQEYVWANAVQGASFFDSGVCLSFKKHVMHSGLKRFTKAPYAIPESASVVVFHGRPNPHEAIRGEWGKPMPSLKRWWKGLKPCHWIEGYWRE